MSLGACQGPSPLHQASSRTGADITPQSPPGHPPVRQEVWELRAVPCPHLPSSQEKVGAAGSLSALLVLGAPAPQGSSHLEIEATWLFPSP